MSQLKAWQINDCDVWAGATAEEAIATAIRLTGVPREEIVPDEAAVCEVGRDELVTCFDEPGHPKITVGSILDAMTEPTQVSSTEY